MRSSCQTELPIFFLAVSRVEATCFCGCYRRITLLCYEHLWLVRLKMPIHRDPNYLYLTIGLLTAVVLATSAGGQVSFAIAGVLVAAITFMVTAWFVIQSKRQFLLAVLLALAALLPFIWLVRQPEEQFPGLVESLYLINVTIWLLFTAYIAIVVFRSIMRARRVHANEIYGAIYVYLLIGVIFAVIFQLLLAWNPGAIYFEPSRFGGPLATRNNSLLTRSFGDVLYYSFVTLSTVGFGEVTPASPAARSLSLIEAVGGIMYVATMIARFVSSQSAEKFE
jgi:Ion channel